MSVLSSLHQFSDWGLLALRLGVGTVFLVHGNQKRAMWKMQPSAQLPAGLLPLLRVLSIARPTAARDHPHPSQHASSPRSTTPHPQHGPLADDAAEHAESETQAH